jgi:hypothetical protein
LTLVGSDEFVNYRIRPAKSVERKMFVEATRRLSVFGELVQYRYIGFGSAFFNDFTIFHKQLGLRKMVSIEGNAKERKRYRFNIPFACVDLRIGMSGDLLVDVPWDDPAIIWLDYDSRMDTSILDDVSFVASKAKCGSFLFVTVDAQPLDDLEARVDEVVTLWDGHRSPAQFRPSALGRWGTAREFRRLLNWTISEAVDSRPRLTARKLAVRYRQILHFHYADGNHRMMSVGGVVFRDDQAPLLGTARFSRFPFYRPGDEPYLLEVPSLTPKEVRALQERLPLGRGETLNSGPVPAELVTKYPDFYRYYPTFSEVEV